MEAAAESLRLRSGRDRRSLNSDGPSAPLAIRIPSAAAAAANADGTRAPEKEQEQTEAAPRIVTAMTFPLTPAARPAVRSRRRSPLEPGRSAGTSDSAPNPTGTGFSTCHNATGPLGGGPRTAEPANRNTSRAGRSPTVVPRPPPGLAPIRPERPYAEATVSLSVERRGFARSCRRRGRVLGGSARRMEPSRAEGAGGGQRQPSSRRQHRLKGHGERRTDLLVARGLAAVATRNPLRAERHHVTGRAGALRWSPRLAVGRRRLAARGARTRRRWGARAGDAPAALRRAPGVLPAGLRAKASFPLRKTSEPAGGR